MQLTCPFCSQSLDIDAENAGRDIQCSGCGRFLTVPTLNELAGTPPPMTPPALQQPMPQAGGNATARPVNVVIRDVEIPFLSLVLLLLQVALASIPAFIILGFLYLLFFVVLAGGCAAVIGAGI